MDGVGAVGEWGGAAEFDECSVCGGDNSTCLDCAGVPNGNAIIDNCGICDGPAQFMIVVVVIFLKGNATV